MHPLRSLRLKDSLFVVPGAQLGVEFEPRALGPLLDPLRQILDVHRHAAARDERRPEEPQEHALDERRHERGRVAAARAAPDAAPEPARAHAEHVHALRQVAADVVGELARADVIPIGFGLEMARRIENHVAAFGERVFHDVAESARERRALRRAVLAQVRHRHRAERAQHGRRHNARMEELLVAQSPERRFPEHHGHKHRIDHRRMVW